MPCPTKAAKMPAQKLRSNTLPKCGGIHESAPSILRWTEEIAKEVPKARQPKVSPTEATPSRKETMPVLRAVAEARRYSNSQATTPASMLTPPPETVPDLRMT